MRESRAAQRSTPQQSTVNSVGERSWRKGGSGTRNGGTGVRRRGGRRVDSWSVPSVLRSGSGCGVQSVAFVR